MRNNNAKSEAWIGPTVAKVFTPGFIRTILDDDSVQTLHNLSKSVVFLRDAIESNDLSEFFELAYGFMSSNYRNEYVFQNSIYNQLYPTQQHIDSCDWLAEIRSGESIADIVVISNSEPHAFEVKSAVDNQKKAILQVEQYQKVFPIVSIVSTNNKIRTLAESVPAAVGLYFLSEDLQLEVHRKPETYTKKLDPRTMFKTLRRHEYLELSKKLFGELPDVTPAALYESCLDLALSAPIARFVDVYFEVLRSRSTYNRAFHWPSNTPSVAYLVNVLVTRKKDRVKLLSMLDQTKGWAT